MRSAFPQFTPSGRRHGAAWQRVVLAVALLAALPIAGGVASARQTTQRGLPGVPPLTSGDHAQSEPADPAQLERMERMRTSERQKRMQTDADKLLTLARELKADVDKTTKDEMSLETIRKAAEVEKLARDIKEKMKGQ